MTTINISAGQLKGWLTPPLRTISGDDGLPVLQCVHLRGTGGTLVASSTDRFRATLHRTLPDGYDGDDFAILLPGTSLKGLLAAFPATRGRDRYPLRIDLGADALGHPLLTVTDFENTMTLRAADGYFPNIIELLRGTAKRSDEAPIGTFGANPRFLKDIAAMGGTLDAISIRAPHGTASGPILFEVTPDLLVMLMPRRRAPEGKVDPPLDLDSWLALSDGKRA